VTTKLRQRSLAVIDDYVLDPIAELRRADGRFLMTLFGWDLILERSGTAGHLLRIAFDLGHAAGTGAPPPAPVRRD
jgi:hypothetical protein